MISRRAVTTGGQGGDRLPVSAFHVDFTCHHVVQRYYCDRGDFMEPWEISTTGSAGRPGRATRAPSWGPGTYLDGGAARENVVFST